MRAPPPMGRSRFSVALGLSVFVLAASAARGAGLVGDCGDANRSPDASALAAGLHSCAIQADHHAVVCPGYSGEELAAPPHPAGVDASEASTSVAPAGDEKLAQPEIVPDPPLHPGEPGDASFPPALAARVREALDQRAARAAERAMPLLEAREAERLDEATRSVAGRVQQDFARAVERRLLAAPDGDAPLEIVVRARREEVSRPAVDGSAGSSVTIAGGGVHGAAIASPEVELEVDRWCREPARGR